MKPLLKTFITVTIFSVAMGFMESAVVVYLRELYYPSGFQFPAVPMSRVVLLTELWRETATITMLVCIGIMAGGNFARRFAFFLQSFAVWDLSYYLFLKVILDWPESLFTWDLLFLIPVPWTGPVLAPCLISLSMILFAVIILKLEGDNYKIYFILLDWLMLVLSGIIFIGSFTADYFSRIIAADGSFTLSQLYGGVMQFIPESYNWWLFAAGEIILLSDFYLIYKRSRREIRENNP